ncbi:MAG: diaminopimelate epimerase [Nitrospirae bacterium]|nr:diaminopimelate epimerase [Candidatus Troglogloeales bacterium]MBI3598498.1 diaminopimelate epimerase [Candidatus Troglogloeales bacterium]
MNIPFWKMSGSGNDFVIIDFTKHPIDYEKIPDFVSKVCRRGLSVGADGVIFVEQSKIADYAWHYYNADGGEVAMCGNGSRCVARFAYENKIAKAQQSIETLAGIIHAEVSGNRVRVQLPDPTDLRLHLKIEIEGVVHEGHFVNTGVPHVVYFVDDIEKCDLVKLGRATRYHPLFAPSGTNTNFVQIINRNQIKIRTYERGVEDETLACGTGSVAAAMIATALGKTTPPLQVMTQSQIMLCVDFKQNAATFSKVYLEGDARIIYKGALSEEAL